MTRVLIGKDTTTGEFFETSDLAEAFGLSPGAVLMIGADGAITELRGTETGQTLVWNAATGTWEVSTETIASQRRLLEDILVVLLEIREQAPTPWFVSKMNELETLLTEEVQ